MDTIHRTINMSRECIYMIGSGKAFIHLSNRVYNYIYGFSQTTQHTYVHYTLANHTCNCKYLIEFHNEEWYEQVCCPIIYRIYEWIRIHVYLYTFKKWHWGNAHIYFMWINKRKEKDAFYVTIRLVNLNKVLGYLIQILQMMAEAR